MNQHEARSKAYFIAAHIIEGTAPKLPELIEQDAITAEMSQDDVQAIIDEMSSTVAQYLRSQATYHRSLVTRSEEIAQRRRQGALDGWEIRRGKGGKA